MKISSSFRSSVGTDIAPLTNTRVQLSFDRVSSDRLLRELSERTSKEEGEKLPGKSSKQALCFCETAGPIPKIPFLSF